MYLSGWAYQVGVGKYAACRWYHAGMLPVRVRRAGRLILVEPGDAQAEPGRTVVCARVSSAGQRPDLGRQVARLSSWVTASGMTVGGVVTGIGSAMSGRRGKPGRLLADPAAARIAIGHRDRLASFGAGHLQAVLAGQGRQIMILGSGEVGDGLAGDMAEVLTSFCAWLCGRRGAGNRALRALGCAHTEMPGA